MSVTQKTICVIHHNKKTLPILDYVDLRDLIAMSLSASVILWVYEGMVMLIPAARVANMANFYECYDKVESKKSTTPVQTFNMGDAIILPKQIAEALLGDSQ